MLRLRTVLMEYLSVRQSNPSRYRVAAVALICVFEATLALGTTLWGDKRISAETWYTNNQDSERAARYLYSFFYREEELGVARQLNEKFVEDFPDSPIFAIESLTLCESDPSQFRVKVDRAVERISEASKNFHTHCICDRTYGGYCVAGVVSAFLA